MKENDRQGIIFNLVLNNYKQSDLDKLSNEELKDLHKIVHTGSETVNKIKEENNGNQY